MTRTVEFEYDGDSYVDEEGRTSGEVQRDNEYRDHVLYYAGGQRKRITFEEEEEEEEPEEEPEEEEYECREDDCDRSFGSERGRSIHERTHDDEE